MWCDFGEWDDGYAVNSGCSWNGMCMGSNFVHLFMVRDVNFFSHWIFFFFFLSFPMYEVRYAFYSLYLPFRPFPSLSYQFHNYIHHLSYPHAWTWAGTLLVIVFFFSLGVGFFA